MSGKKLLYPRTWIEVDARAARENIRTFRNVLGRGPELWAVVKSNAYGHGLYAFSALAEKLGVDGFCVDSIIEAVRLRESGIKKFILVLGPTSPDSFGDAVARDITLSVATGNELKFLARMKSPPFYHLKVDTGMNRRGFFVRDAVVSIRFIAQNEKLASSFRGLYTHFASAKDVNYPTYTDFQLEQLLSVRDFAKKRGLKGFTTHAAASGGTLIKKRYHCDAVRVGIGLYGLWPSKELEVQRDDLALFPVLSWRTFIAEVKTAEAGSYIGYDLTERLRRRTKLAVLPVGYWHGFSRSLSGPVGEVLVRGKRAPVLGRVSMDLVVVDVTGIGCDVGDRVTLIGRDGKEEIKAPEVAGRAGTIHYEFLTRLNPLIERRITGSGS